MCLRSIWTMVRGSLSTRFKRRVPLVSNQNYNRKMLNCMECDVPVGVIFATEVGYKVLGLAFVEWFEPENGWFVWMGLLIKADRTLVLRPT